jgi:hypothetical protein
MSCRKLSIALLAQKELYIYWLPTIEEFWDFLATHESHLFCVFQDTNSPE